MATSVISLSDFKARASQFLEEISASQHPIVITQNGSAAAVVQDYESYQRMQDSVALLRLMVQGEADIKEGRLTPQREVFSSLRKRLKGRDG
ncbi:MAG: type II toxin-antitoxin system prevent-host-death family antitoxin [Gammaproteobacteria bacterium]|jgi:prevent-host-death family protein|nr:type II toxin-antitoxin system prevent-host-death family antitoxin [Gammaproteobacteria bacterium]